MCNNTDFERCMECRKYVVHEGHSHRDKPDEEIVICCGGTKKWERVNNEYHYKTEDLIDNVIQLNENLESLIDVAHATYMGCTDETEKVRLDGQIRAYWQAKHMVEDILKM